MRYRKLSPDDDYTFGNGQQDFYNNEPAAVGQSVKTRLLLWLGEWYLDITAGTTYMQGILGKFSPDQANAIIQDRVISTDGVTDITKYESPFDADNRALAVTFSLDTIYGPTQVQLENYVDY